MSVLDALFWVVCLVLVVAGASKVAAPDAVASTLSALGPQRRGVGARSIGRLVGVAEVVVAVSALSIGGPVLGSLVGIAYAAFAVVVVLARRRGLPSCGCFGASSAPPSLVHVVVDVTSAAVAGAAVIAGRGHAPVPVADGLAGSVATGVVVASLVLVAAVGVVVVDTLVAEVVEATSRLRHQSDHDPTHQGAVAPVGGGVRAVEMGAEGA